jgi:prepilin-type N-terminal cleavage/methylation domain-containing protein
MAMSGNRGGSQTGFSLVELLIAMLIVGVVSAAILDLVAPATAAFDTQLEVSDLQQRLRVAVSTLQRDLAAAGAGAYRGGSLGVLGDHLAPVLPYRWGASNPDPPGTFRTDTITVLFVPDAAAETAVVRRMPPVGSEQVIETRANCGGARHDARCGFTPGMRTLLLRPGAQWDVGLVAQVHDAALHLVGAPPLPPEYDRGDAVAAQLDAHTYYLKTDVPNDRFELMHYDGDQTDLPVVDHVVKLEFRYWGAPRPPQLIAGRALSDPGPWTTYGPPPPDIGTLSGTAWPEGENCVFTVVAGAHVPRLAGLVPNASGFVELNAPLLNDGPWCPDAASAFRYDADLLRLRRIDVTLRVEAGPAWLRGPASRFFMRAGTAETRRYVPDQEVTFTVAPRNLGTER